MTSYLYGQLFLCIVVGVSALWNRRFQAAFSSGARLRRYRAQNWLFLA
jgi:hypothetical protein